MNEYTMGNPIRVIKKNDTNKEEPYMRRIKGWDDFIGTYGTPNTYTADLPESERDQYTSPDSSQRIAYKNPNHSYV